MINTRINKIRDTQISKNFLDNEELSESDLEMNIRELLAKGVNKHTIKDCVLPELGYSLDSLPLSIHNLLEGN